MAKMSGGGREKIFLAISLLSLPGILSATTSFKTSYSQVGNKSISAAAPNSCVHGFCTEADICECNPCWSGPTCQDYVDRFPPRFLAEEPFFILNYESRPEGASSKFSTPFSSSSRSYRGGDRGGEVPLFRIESSDDDLGLTCQLGEVGPSATCPCATPRYAVVGHSANQFYADPETGDVFLQRGQRLETGKQYFITLQVAALDVKDAVQEHWKEEISARLYVRSAVENIDVSTILADYLKIKDLEFEKEAENDPGLSAEEAQNLYMAHYLPRARALHSPFKRQAPKIRKRRKVADGDESKIKLFFTPSLLHWQSFSDEDRIKVGLQIQLPSSSTPNFMIEVSIKANIGHKFELLQGNVTEEGFLPKNRSKPSFRITNGVKRADSVTWTFENIRPIRSEPKRKERNGIHLEGSLSIANRLSNFQDLSRTRIPAIENLTLVAQISFPLDQQLRRGVRPTKIQTFIQFPIRSGSTLENRPLTPVGNVQGNSGESKLSSPLPNSPQTNGKVLDDGESPMLEVVGPFEIPRGSSGSYIIRLPVKADLTRELTLSLRQIEDLAQGPILVRDLQLISADEKLSLGYSPMTRPEFEVECRNSSSGGESGDERKGPPSLEGCSLRTKGLDWRQGESGVRREAESRMIVLEFEGTIYSLPDSAIGSRFELQAVASVGQGSRQSLMMMMTGPSRPESRTQQLDDNLTTPATTTTVTTVTFSGRIVGQDQVDTASIDLSRNQAPSRQRLFKRGLYFNRT